jgi:hypothetical protein
MYIGMRPKMTRTKLYLWSLTSSSGGYINGRNSANLELLIDTKGAESVFRRRIDNTMAKRKKYDFLGHFFFQFTNISCCYLKAHIIYFCIFQLKILIIIKVGDKNNNTTGATSTPPSLKI